MSDWQDLRLGDVLTLQRGFDITKKTQRPGSVPVVTSSGIASFHDESRVPGPGVVVGRKGSLGTTFFLREPFWPHDTTLWVKDFKGNDPYFCFLLLKLLRLADMDVGSSNPTLNRNHAHMLRVALPSQEAQRAVAAVLSAFDDLIAINERRLELLEDLARSLFREWFDRFRCISNGARADALDEGALPAGWTWVTLGSAAAWFSGGTPDTKEPKFWDGDIPWITSGSLRSLLLRDTERRLTPAGVAAGSRVVDRDALLFVVRGMSLVKEFRVGIAERTVAFGQDCKALVAHPGVAPLLLAFTVLARQNDIQGMVELAGHGTGKLATDRIKAVRFPLPPPHIQAAFVEARLSRFGVTRRPMRLVLA